MYNVLVCSPYSCSVKQHAQMGPVLEIKYLSIYHIAVKYHEFTRLCLIFSQLFETQAKYHEPFQPCHRTVAVTRLVGMLFYVILLWLSFA